MTPGRILVLDVPVPPSTNHLFAMVQGRRVKTSAYRAYTSEAAWAAKAKWQAQGRPEFSGPLSVTIRLGIGRHRDIDNCAKPIIDAVFPACGLPDDRWIDRLTLTRDPEWKGVRVTITSAETMGGDHL